MKFTDSKAITTISRWLNCSPQDAGRIFNGVYAMNGDSYSAFLVEDKDIPGGNKLEICKNGFTIHLISLI